MRTASESTVVTVALIGNPNTGKSTLFNALAGVRQRVGNFPGVTVEKKEGRLQTEQYRYRLIDLPGTYSLAPRSPDEMVAVDLLLGRRSDVPPIDLVLCIVDASNLERNLYLVSQVLELGLPVVLALNMVDVAAAHGLEIDVPQLSARLDVPIVPLRADKRRGIGELKSALDAAVATRPGPRESPFPAAFCSEVDQLGAVLRQQPASPPHANRHQPTLWHEDAGGAPRYLVERLLLDTSGYLESLTGAESNGAVHAQIAGARQRLAADGLAVPAIEAMARYGWVARVVDGVLRRPATRRVTLTDRLDRVLTHRVWGTLAFLLLMTLVFQSVFSWAIPAMDVIDGAMGTLAEAVESTLPEGPLASMLVDGLIGGVGGVLVFLPQIFILFFFIAVLEDCGYMARAAYLMDRLMVRVGLSGKSFIPLLSSFACAIPGVMATRVIESRRDRLTTILVAPLMSCSARLPVYTVLIAAFIPQRELVGWDFGPDGIRFGLSLGLQGLTMVAMYLVGMVTAVVVALVLKKTLLRGPTPSFVMELPSYKWPSPAVVFYRMFERGWSFVRRAGTLIVAVSIIVWASLYYPRPVDKIEGPLAPRRSELKAQAVDASLSAEERAAAAEALVELENHVAGLYQQQSILGRAGQWIEPVVRPLGWDWRIGCAVIASFPAREVVVATLGVIYNLGQELDVSTEEDVTRLGAAMREARWDRTGEPVFNVPVALSLMVFFALCAQCAATLVVIRRETNSWRWPAFTFLYMTSLAYVAALVTYQVGMQIGG